MAKIYNDFQPANLMSFAKSFARLNGQPLDKSEIWYNLADAQDYAATEAAYVGQILAVIDSEKNKVVFYGIQDAAGTLTEVGATPLGDNLSIEVINGVIQLKDFGKEYYAFVPAEKDENGNIIKASEYILTEGFKEGLELRVIANEEKFAIAWYEPNTEDINELSESIESIKNALNAEDGLIDQIEKLKENLGQPSDDSNDATGLHKVIEDLSDVVNTKANAEDVYTKEETNTAIATAIAGVDHLKRIIVNSKNDIDVNAEDADLFIYMVPTGLQVDDDKYDEYVVIDGIIEKVGSWEVDLSNYATKTELSNLDTKVNTLSEVVTDNKEDLDEKILNLKNDLEDEVERATAAEAANAAEIQKKADKATTLEGYGITDTYTKSEITKLIGDITGGESAADVKAQLEEFKSNTNTTLQAIRGDLDKLQGAEPNYISSVDENNFSVSGDGKLSLVSVNIAQVNGLQEIINNSTISTEERNALQSVINGTFDNYIKSVTSDFEVSEEGQLKLVNVSKDALKAIIGDITTLIDYTEGTTLVSEINDIKQLLIWQEMVEQS